jgi:thioredoxin-related protein
MKKMVLWLGLPLLLMGADIDWNSDFVEAQAQAKKDHKPLLVLITSEQCRWCRKFEATTLQDSTIAGRINTDFASVHVTRDKSIYPKNLTAKMVPMSYFLDDEGKVIYSIPGYWGVEDYNSVLDDAIRKYKK